MERYIVLFDIERVLTVYLHHLEEELKDIGNPLYRIVLMRKKQGRLRKYRVVYYCVLTDDPEGVIKLVKKRGGDVVGVYKR